MATAFNVRNLPPPVSPLLRSPVINTGLNAAIKAQNRWSDPYALAAALGSLGTGYGDMNKELFGGVTAQNAIANQQYQQRLHDEMQQAFQQTVADLGQHMVGTPEFNMKMHDYLTTMEGHGAFQKQFDAARKSLENQAMQRGLLKAGLEKMIAKEYAQDYYNKNLQQYNFQTATPEERQQALDILNKNAWAYGNQTVKSLDLQPVHDPVTGQWTVRDNQLNEHPLPAPLLANALIVTGQKGGWDAFNAAQGAINKEGDVNRANAQAAAQIALREAQAGKAEATTGATGAGKVAAVDHSKDPYLKFYADELSAARKRQDAVNKDQLASKTDKEKAAQDVEDARQAYLGRLAQLPGVIPPAGATGTAGPAPGSLTSATSGAAPTAGETGPASAPTAPGPGGTITLPAGTTAREAPGVYEPTSDVGATSYAPTTPMPTTGMFDVMDLGTYALPPPQPGPPGPTQFDQLISQYQP